MVHVDLHVAIFQAFGALLRQIWVGYSAVTCEILGDEPAGTVITPEQRHELHGWPLKINSERTLRGRAVAPPYSPAFFEIHASRHGN